MLRRIVARDPLPPPYLYLAIVSNMNGFTNAKYMLAIEWRKPD